MIKLRSSKTADGPRVLEIWAAAVDATHHFLTKEDREAIGEEVAGFLPQASLILAVDAADHAIGFMLVDNGHLEALFIDPAHHGLGVGRQMVVHALSRNSGLYVDVNTQNPGALAFYQRMGFTETGHSAFDGQGRPYPLVHMRHCGPAS